MSTKPRSVLPCTVLYLGKKISPNTFGIKGGIMKSESSGRVTTFPASNLTCSIIFRFDLGTLQAN